jgi:TRAP-type uncharacterized transport system fused permease subunit
VLTVGSVSNMIAMQHFGVSFADLASPPMGDLSPDAYRALLQTTAASASWVLIASHMIVYWFSQDSNITPPVCVAAYAGAAIAGSDPWKTGWTSFKFAKFLYIGPFLFAYSQGFLLHGDPVAVVMTWVTIALATVAFGSLTMGYLSCGMNPLEWGIMAVATVILFFPGLVHAVGIDVPDLAVDGLGIVLWAVVFLLQKARIKRDPTLTLPMHEQRKLKKALA